MKIIIGNINLNDKSYGAAMIDYDEYDVESGTINLNSKTFSASKIYGVESENEE